MPREFLKVEGVSSTTKDELRRQALTKFGRPSASLMVASLIADHMAKGSKTPVPEVDLTSAMVPLEVRLPASAVQALDAIAEQRLARSRNSYAAALILKELGAPQLQTDQIETLRRSNYELTKVGTNLNQIAKAFNTLVQMQGAGKVPELGKKIASLRKEISAHTSKVLRVLEAGTVVYEKTGTARKSS